MHPELKMSSDLEMSSELERLLSTYMEAEMGKLAKKVLEGMEFDQILKDEAEHQKKMLDEFGLLDRAIF